MNIADILISHARTRPDHPAIEDGERIITYAALDAAVTDAASNIQAVGIDAGDIVAILGPDSAGHLIVLCALARVGAVIYWVNISLSKNALEESLNTVPVKALITSVLDFPRIFTLWLAAKDICGLASMPFDAPRISDNDPVTVIQPSGTTGTLKTLIRSHAQTVDWFKRYAKCSGWTAAERCLCITSMFFNIGRHISLSILYIGATVVINRAENIEDVVKILCDKLITYFKVTPVYLLPMLDLPGEAPLFPGLRAMAVGSASITHANRMRAREKVDAELRRADGNQRSRTGGFRGAGGSGRPPGRGRPGRRWRRSADRGCG